MVTAVGSDPTHHLILTDGLVSVGCVLTDPSGERNERVLRRFPHADPAQPYSTETQRDWSGGMANPHFEDNRTAYWTGSNVDPSKSGALTLGPLFRYAKGYRGSDMVQPVGSIGWRPLIGSTLRAAIIFTASFTTPTGLGFWVRSKGTPGNLTYTVKNNNAGNPGTDRYSNTISTPTLGESTYLWVGVSTSLVIGTSYWIEYKGATTDDAENHWEILAQTQASNGKTSPDGTTWTPSNEDYSFRLIDADKPFVARFYEYKGQMYAALDYDDNSTPKLFMNGWRGATDDNSGADLNKLKDATQTEWSSRPMANLVARMIAGPPTTEIEDWRITTGQGSGYVTVSPSWNIPHTTGSDYVLLGSDEWFELNTGSSLVRVTDVGVANGIVYFCGGDELLVMHREFNNGGNWTADGGGSCWLKGNSRGHFVKVLNDPISGTVLWFGLNHNMIDRNRPTVTKTQAPLDWNSANMNTLEIDSLNAIWTAGTADVSVALAAPPVQQVSITVKIGRVTTINATPTAGGTGYQVGNVLTIAQVGSGLNATVTVSTIGGGGAVTAVTLTTGGWDYTTGVGKPTTGGTGTGCTIEITGISSFGTGVIAYRNLPALVDVRYGTQFNILPFVDQAIGVNELQFLMDDSTGVASPVIAINLPRMDAKVWYNLFIDYDAGAVAGAEKIASIGLQLMAAQPKTFTITLHYRIQAFNRYLPVDVGAEGDNITGLETYGDPEGLWVFTETGIGEVSNNQWIPAPLRELKVARHPTNGRAHTVHDVYLILSWRGRAQRYFRQNLEDLGPDFPSDLSSIRGQVVAAATYPGRIYFAVDGGPSRPSQVLCYQGQAWSEVYTSRSGARIRNIYIQAIPGKSDRLWISVGSDIGYIQLLLDPTNRPADSDYQYAYEGRIEHSWIHGQRRDQDKVFKDVTIYTDVVDANRVVDLQYILDKGDNTFADAGTVAVSPHETLDFASGNPPAKEKMTGHHVRTRLRLHTYNTTLTPIIREVTTRLYTIPEIKYGYSWLTKISSLSINLRGDEEKALGSFDTVQLAMNQLDTWATTLTPLSIQSDLVMVKDKLVILEPLPAQLLRTVPDEKLEEDVVQLAANDI